MEKNLRRLLEQREAIKIKNSSRYEVLEEVHNVLVKVPKVSGYMMPQNGFTTADNKKIPSYWRNGKPLEKGTFLNVFFYNISRNDHEKKIVAKVKVIKKVLPDGREFVMLDVFRNDHASKAEYDLKIVTKKESAEPGTEIMGTNRKIVFRKIEKK